MYYGEPSYMSSPNSYAGQYFPNIIKLEDKIAQIDAQSVYTTSASEENSQAWNTLLSMLYDSAHTEGGEQVAEILYAKMDFANSSPFFGLMNWDAQKVKTAAMALDPVVVAQQASLPKTSQAWKRASARFNFTSKVPDAEGGSYTPPIPPTGNGQNGGDPPPAGFKFPWLEVLVIGGIGVGGYLLYQTKVKKKKYAVLDAAKSYATLGGIYADDAAGKAKRYADAKIAQRRAKKNRAYRY